MQVGKAIKSLLNTAGYNCYPEVIPETVTGDAIVYTVISDIPLTSKERTSLVDTFRVQINCYSHSYPNAVTLAQNVRAALDRKSGTYNTVVVDQINFIDQGSSYDLDMNEVGIRQDYYVRIKL
jgi:hypothetical protein